MARITVTLSASEREALRLAAERDLRDLRGQARYLIVKSLAAELTTDTQPVKAQPSGGSNERQA
jgi:hypothetical protein